MRPETESKPKKLNPDAPENARNHVIGLKGLPFGFFELEMAKFFSQFGKVRRVRIRRNKYGGFTGRGYVFFANADVATLAAEAMHNYLMFNQKLEAKVLEKIPPMILSGPRVLKVNVSKKAAARHQWAVEMAAHKTDNQVKIANERLAANLRKSLDKLKEAGYDYTFKFKVP